jgi:hypothetical protein
MVYRRPSPRISWTPFQMARGAKKQMKTWEHLCRRSGVDRFTARSAAHELADTANALGMFSSDSLQLAISAVEAHAASLGCTEWLASVKAGRVVSEANGLNLAWMPREFNDHELVTIGQAGIRAAGGDPAGWALPAKP